MIVLEFSESKVSKFEEAHKSDYMLNSFCVVYESIMLMELRVISYTRQDQKSQVRVCAQKLWLGCMNINHYN